MNSVKRATLFPVLIYLGALTMLAGCGAGSGQLTSSALQGLVGQGKAPVIVDVRSQGEYDRAHIRGALHIPFYAVAKRHREISDDKATPVVVYCAHGPRAWWAAFLLRRQGFRQVSTLAGNFRAWQQGGFAISGQ